MASPLGIRIKIRKNLIEGRTDETVAIIKTEPLAILIVVESLEDPIAVIRQNATEILGKLGDEYTIKYLPPMLSDPDLGVQWRAASALALLGDEHAIERLGSFLGTKLHDETIKCLARIGNSSVDNLLKLLTNPNEEVRVGVVQALGSIGDQQTIEPLIKSLYDNSSRVRESAVNSLIQVGVIAVDSLVSLLGDADIRVLTHIIDILIRIGDSRAIKPIIQCFSRGEELQQRIHQGLLTFETTHVIRSLIEALNSNNENICRECLILLWTMGEEVIDPLLHALKTGTEKIRLEIITILGKIRDDRIKKVLLQALKDPNEKIRKAVAETLGEISDEEVVESLIEALQDDHVDVRASAASALMNTGDRRAVASLVAALRDPYREVRRNAAKALLKMPRESVVYDLVHSYKQDKKKIDSNPIEALVEISSPEAIEFLIALSVNREFRNSIIAALLTLDHEAVRPLINALKWEDVEIRCTAAFLLGKIGTKQAIKPLISSLGDQDQNVRTAARIALQELLGKLGYSSAKKFLENPDE